MPDSTSVQSKSPLISAGLRYMAISSFFFSIMGLLVKVAGQRLPSQEIVFFRSLLVLGFAYAMIRRAGASALGNDKKWLVVRGSTGFVALSCFYYGVTHLPLADATLIMYTNPVFTGILAAIFLAESINVADVVGVVVSLIGVVLVAQPSFIFGGAGRLDPVAVGIALVGAVISATSYVIVRKLRATEHELTVVFYFPLISVPASIPIALPSAVLPTWTELAVLLGVGVVTFIAQVTMTRGLHLEKAGRATAVSYLQVVFAFIWGMLFFDEYPTVYSIVGAVLIIGSTVAVAWWNNRRPAAEAAR